ncbi:DUF2254 family protein [Sorangium sp. So ce176]|uniref:DUF2254 family protein n=1 Tax=Sorangium sp. So ce176 TaxID=3133286 RepID=UPI003F64450C
MDELYMIGGHRTADQDPSFGVQQIVDVALKALSPGINDTTTAVTCVDYLSAILARAAGRRPVSPYRFDGGELRVIAQGSRSRRCSTSRSARSAGTPPGTRRSSPGCSPRSRPSPAAPRGSETGERSRATRP